MSSPAVQPPLRTPEKPQRSQKIGLEASPFSTFVSQLEPIQALQAGGSLALPSCLSPEGERPAARCRVKLYDAADCSGSRAADGADLMNFLLPSPLSSPSTALQLFSPGGPGSARRDQRRSSRTPAFPDLSFSPFFARSGNPAAPQAHQEVQVKEESGCSQQLGQPTPAQPSQPEQPTRSQRRRALNFSEPEQPAAAGLAEQPGFVPNRVSYGEAYVDEAQLARSYAQTMGQVPLPPFALMRVASEQIAPTASMPQLPHAHSQPAGAHHFFPFQAPGAGQATLPSSAAARPASRPSFAGIQPQQQQQHHHQQEQQQQQQQIQQQQMQQAHPLAQRPSTATSYVTANAGSLGTASAGTGTTLDMQPRAQVKKGPKRKRSQQGGLAPESSLLSSFPLSSGADWWGREAEGAESSLLSSFPLSSGADWPVRKTKCNCKKTQCLKLYCECFKAGQMCVDCSCQGCSNTPANMPEVEERRAAVKERDPRAFDDKIQSDTHRQGCNCKKSGCMKKYCECYEAGVPCGPQCKCSNCQNCGPGASGPSGMLPGMPLPGRQATSVKSAPQGSQESGALQSRGSLQHAGSMPPTGLPPPQIGFRRTVFGNLLANQPPEQPQLSKATPVTPPARSKSVHTDMEVAAYITTPPSGEMSKSSDQDLMMLLPYVQSSQTNARSWPPQQQAQLPGYAQTLGSDTASNSPLPDLFKVLLTKTPDGVLVPYSVEGYQPAASEEHLHGQGGMPSAQAMGAAPMRLTFDDLTTETGLLANLGASPTLGQPTPQL